MLDSFGLVHLEPYELQVAPICVHLSIKLSVGLSVFAFQNLKRWTLDALFYEILSYLPHH